MRKAIPWGVRGGGVDVREAARGAARRDGMSLSEWLAQAVGQYAARAGTDPANLDEDECVEAIAAQLQRLGTHQAHAAKSQSAPAKPHLVHANGRPARSAKSYPSDAGPAAAIEDMLLEKAVARLEDGSGVQPVGARRKRHEPELAPAQPSSPQTFSLGNAIAEITRRQRALEDQAHSFDRSHQDQSAPDPALADRTAITATLENLRSDIVALAGHVQGLRHEHAERGSQPATCNLDRLRSEIATMSEALRDLAARGSIAPLEATIRNLSQQIETSRNDGIRETVLQPLERLVNDLRLALAEVDPRMTIRGLESEVKKLGIKLAPVEKIERQVEALTESFDRFRDHAARHQFTERREDADLQAVADELRSLTGDRGSLTLAKIESQLATIADKVEEALAEARDESRYTALADRINDVHRELAERMSHGMPQIDIHALETLVRSLAQKIEDAHGPRADSRAIEALQNQVSEFAAQLDRANAGFPSLTSLERSIGDLFTEIERTRDVSYAAAEKAARSALDQALATTAAAHQQSDMAHEFGELRTKQDEAGRRTIATLNAVQETLEKVVDRLAMVESEIAGVRDQKPAELLASGPAPNFAPAPQRAPAPLAASKAAPESRAHKRKGEALAPGDSGKPRPEADLSDDFLIEPGRGLPRRDRTGDEGGEAKAKTPADSLDMLEAGPDRAGFIAAARRAAQAAQMESATATARTPSRAGARAEGSAGLIEQTRNFISHYKRPVVLSVAALCLAVGAYAVVRTTGHAPFIDFSTMNGKEIPAHSLPAGARVQSNHDAPAAAPVPTPPKPAAANAPVEHENIAQQSIPGSDPIVTGAIGAKPQQADAAARSAMAAPHETSPALLQNLARAGNAKAQYELAADYMIGHTLPRDLGLAAQWYEKAAAQGLAPAQYRLGSLYEKGLGVRRDTNTAIEWYRKAAEHGNVRAMHNLAVLLAEGGANGKPDYASAAQWFRQAAEYGVRDSQYNAAILLARGLGVPQNLRLSYVWFAIAAAQGDEDAGKKRDEVGARLNAADLAAAKATAAAFHAKTPDPAANEVTPPPGGWTLPTPTTNKVRPKVSRL